jgi:ER lumen protein retaining receptor
MYLEAVAMFPQIYMFQRQSGDQGGIVEALIGHTMFAIGFSRVVEFVFWGSCFTELVDNNGWHLPGYIIVFSQLCHLLIMGDFFYYYFKSISKGSLSKGLPISLPPSSYSSVV